MWPLLSAVLLAGVAAPPEVPVLGREVTADGRLGPAETGAREVRADGMRARLGRRGDVLAVAVELEASGISSLLVGAGDRVWVLHASAALGTGEYRCGADGACTRTREFDYRCRDPSSAPAAVRCRTDFWTADGWIANVGPSGTRTREFLVDLRRFDPSGAPVTLAVTGLVLPDQARRWPSGEDDAGSVKLQQGFLEERMRFRPRGWLRVSR
ncbi:MAG TPA: hypothetical protein VFD38_00810 [Myxococcaceae bacterium]|nr:hypothetical protein [Myxococcaceae bacterium]